MQDKLASIYRIVRGCSYMLMLNQSYISSQQQGCSWEIDMCSNDNAYTTCYLSVYCYIRIYLGVCKYTHVNHIYIDSYIYSMYTGNTLRTMSSGVLAVHSLLSVFSKGRCALCRSAHTNTCRHLGFAGRMADILESIGCYIENYAGGLQLSTHMNDICVHDRMQHVCFVQKAPPVCAW